MQPDIIKAGALILRNKKLLIVKPYKHDFWIFPGGKPEGEEALEEALIREIHEEISVKTIGIPVQYSESPIEKAAGDPKERTCQIFAYLVDIDGEPVASAEIEMIHWLSREEFEKDTFNLGSIMRDNTIPQLIREGKM